MGPFTTWICAPRPSSSSANTIGPRPCPISRFERARVHSISPDPQTGDPVVRAFHRDGSLKEAAVDLVVLALGQRPAGRHGSIWQRPPGWRSMTGDLWLINRSPRCTPVVPVSSAVEQPAGSRPSAESVTQASAAALGGRACEARETATAIGDALQDIGKENEADDRRSGLCSGGGLHLPGSVWTLCSRGKLITAQSDEKIRPSPGSFFWKNCATDRRVAGSSANRSPIAGPIGY